MYNIEPNTKYLEIVVKHCYDCPFTEPFDIFMQCSFDKQIIISSTYLPTKCPLKQLHQICIRAEYKENQNEI